MILKPALNGNNIINRFKHILQTLLEHSQIRFYKKYATVLREKHYYSNPKYRTECIINTGEIVIIQNGNLPKTKWQKRQLEKTTIW